MESPTEATSGGSDVTTAPEKTLNFDNDTLKGENKRENVNTVRDVKCGTGVKLFSVLSLKTSSPRQE